MSKTVREILTNLNRYIKTGNGNEVKEYGVDQATSDILALVPSEEEITEILDYYCVSYEDGRLAKAIRSLILDKMGGNNELT